MCDCVRVTMLLTAIWCGSFVSLFAQDAERESYLRLHYDKREEMIPMRDGVKLFTAIYTPKDTTKTYPIIIKRTPYGSGPYGVNKYPTGLSPSWHFVEAGYIFVHQDVRGRFMSEGTFQQVTPHVVDKTSDKNIDESTDAYDTIDWLVKHIPGHNGNVGMAGISYPGFYASAGMIDAHPNLKAVSPQAPVSDWYFDDFLHHGTFFLAHAYSWLNSHGQERTGPTTERATPKKLPSIDGYHLFLEAGTIAEINKRYLKDSVPFWNEMMEHPNRDEFWHKRNILPHLKNVAPHVMVVTGWYDAEDLYGSFKTYEHIEAQNPNVNNVLVVGPWIHGGWARQDGSKLGDIHFGSNTSEFYQKHIEFPFFEKYLKGTQTSAPQEATVFETGSNTWRTFDDWPPKESKQQSLYLNAGGKLSFDAPSAPTDKTRAFDEYVSDPARPVPFTEQVTAGMAVEYMVEDQRFAARRPDVLVYQTEILEEDVVIAGAIPVDLWVSTTGTDADFIVKLIDVFPDGDNAAALPNYQMKVRSESFRGRYHKSYEKPEPFIPNQPTLVHFDLMDVLHRFKKGHRIMVQIQSTWFPLIDRNPQTFVENIYQAKPEDFQKATHRIWFTPEYATRLNVNVVK